MFEHLKNIPLFSSLKEEEIESISDKLEQVTFPIYTTIFEEGDPGDCLFIILDGVVEVYVDAMENSDKIILSNLSQGDYFGEMALITGEARSASVRTLSDCTLIKLGKNEFDQLIIKNPSISLSLSHMLSQRLKNANIKRAEAETIYKSKMKPSGSLAEIAVYDVLKFCEQNSLTGRLNLDKNEDHAEVTFIKGQLQQVIYNEFLDDQAMDEILKWEEGTFQIEPSLLEIEQKEKEITEQENTDSEDPIIGIEYFTNNLINTLITIIGLRRLQEIMKDRKESLIPFFPNLENMNFDLTAHNNISFSKSEKFGDKEILSVSVFLKVLIENCKQFTFGMSFLNLQKLAGSYYNILESRSFFEYMSHAKEFVTD